MSRTFRVLATASLWLVTSSASAQDDLDEILGGFDEEEPTREAPAEPSEPSVLPGWLDLGGAVTFAASYNVIQHRSDALPDRASYGGLSRLRAKLDLEADAELPGDWKARVDGYAFYDAAYRIRGRSDYTDEVLDVYEWDAELGEANVGGAFLDHFDAKLGRQIVNWGRSDTLRVLDVVNPLDNRDPGQVDIEDLRRPVTAARFDAFFGDWSLTGLVIPEIRYDLLPPFGSDYVPSAFPLPRTDAPDHWGEEPEFGGVLNGVFRGWDLSLHAGRFVTNTPRVGLGKLEHDRFNLYGGGGNWTLGSWLVKGEVAYFEGLEFSDGRDRDRIDGMAGLEYYGVSDVTVALEVVNRHLLQFDSRIRRTPDQAERNALETALRVTADLMNSRLHLVGLAMIFGERAQNGTILRLTVSYDLRDALAVEVGYLAYWQGDRAPLSTWGDNDRVFAEISWSF